MTEWERTGPLSRGQGETCAGPNPALRQASEGAARWLATGPENQG